MGIPLLLFHNCNGFPPIILRIAPYYSTIPPNEKPLTEFMKAMEDELRTQSRLIGEVFPENADVYYMFAERMFEDVVGLGGLVI